MKSVIRSLLFLSVGLIVIGLAACGGSATATSSSTAANPTLPIHTTTATVGGKTETILTDARGFALYYYTSDTATTTACTGGCAEAWPPLVATNSQNLTGAALPGKVTIQQTADGKQIEYNGHMLYTFLSDTAPGQVTGDHAGNWFVATPNLH